jgi:hypothetical protein
LSSPINEYFKLEKKINVLILRNMLLSWMKKCKNTAGFLISNGINKIAYLCHD